MTGSIKHMAHKSAFITIAFWCVFSLSSACLLEAYNYDDLELDEYISFTKEKALEVVKTGFNAGDGYGEVWIRDYNTFIELSAEVYEPEVLKDNLLIFFSLQGSDGNIVDGFMPSEKATWDGYDFRRSELDKRYAGHKNTVETDQESSLVQAVYKYIRVTGDSGILNVKIGDMTVAERLDWSMDFLMNHRYNGEYGLLWGATTADWGDVQPEHSWGVFLDKDSHIAIDIYDNAMFMIALQNLMELIPDSRRKWETVHDSIAANCRKHLWDEHNQKFIPHIYLDSSPFPDDINEGEVYYHGGTAVAIEAGLLSRNEINISLQKMVTNVESSGAASIGLTLYPTYPEGSFKNKGMHPYGYQNGGDWTWFGGRMIQQLVKHGFVEEAREQIFPMVKRVKENDGFYEWYSRDNEPKGSGTFRGSAGVLYKAIQMIEKAKSAQQPNIIFIMSDDHAYQAVSAYRKGLIKTPHIDSIAEQGILFQNAFVTNSLCAPSRAAILTGKFSHLNGLRGNGEIFDGSQNTLPKILQENGYQTAIVGKWHLKSDPTGFDYWNILPGQGDYYNPDFINMGEKMVYSGYVTEIITQLSKDWLNKRRQDQPFFLMMHHKAPHRSWMPAQQNLELFNDQTFDLPGTFYDDYVGREALQRNLLTVKDHMDIRLDQKIPCESCDTAEVNSWAPGEYWRRLKRMSEDEREEWDRAYAVEEDEFQKVRNNPEAFDQWKYQRYMEDYLRCIVSVDESVGEVLSFLKENDLEQDTVVIYTSDQGFFLGEHGLFDKRFMYEEAMRTPLLMQYPEEIRKGMKAGQLVQNIDIAPTLLDLAGVDIPGDMQGASMMDIWIGRMEEWRDAVYYHYYVNSYGTTPHYGIRTDRYKLIHFYGDIDSWELFDLKKDPEEMMNLAGEKKYQSILNSLKERLVELQEGYEDSASEN